MSFGLAGLFAAGLATFATPCVLPLIPIYLSALAGSDIRNLGTEKNVRGRLLGRALLFSVGFLSVFVLMGLTASSIGGFLADYKSQFRVLGGLLIFLFALKFLGLVHVPLFDRVVRADERRFTTRFEAVNALLMGVVFAAGWSPCIGPILGSVLTYTASNASDPASGALYLFVYGLGFAAPLGLTALFAEAGVRALRKINPYLPKIEKTAGAALLLVSLSFLLDGGGPVPEAAASPPTSLCFNQDAGGDSQPAMVEFYSKNCTICQRMKPIVDGIATQCHGKQVLVKSIDVSNPDKKMYVSQYRLVGVPTFVFLNRDGTEVARLVGEQREESLLQAISALRGEPCPAIGALPSGTAGPERPLPSEFSSDATNCNGELQSAEREAHGPSCSTD